MSRDESLKLIYFGVKRSKVKVTRHKNIAGVRGPWCSCECSFLLVIIAINAKPGPLGMATKTSRVSRRNVTNLSHKSNLTTNDRFLDGLSGE